MIVITTLEVTDNKTTGIMMVILSEHQAFSLEKSLQIRRMAITTEH